MHRLIGSSEDLKIAGSAVEAIGIRKEQPFEVCLGSLQALQQLSLAQSGGLMAHRRAGIQSLAHLCDGPAFDERDLSYQHVAACELLDQRQRADRLRQRVDPSLDRPDPSLEAPEHDEAEALTQYAGRHQLASHA